MCTHGVIKKSLSHFDYTCLHMMTPWVHMTIHDYTDIVLISISSLMTTQDEGFFSFDKTWVDDTMTTHDYTFFLFLTLCLPERWQTGSCNYFKTKNNQIHFFGFVTWHDYMMMSSCVVMCTHVVFKQEAIII